MSKPDRVFQIGVALMVAGIIGMIVVLIGLVKLQTLHP